MTKLQMSQHVEGSATHVAAGAVISANGPGEDAVATDHSKLAVGSLIALASYFLLWSVTNSSEAAPGVGVIVVMLAIPYCAGIWLMCRACRQARWFFIILGGIALALVAWKLLLWAAPAIGSDEGGSGADGGDASSEGGASGSSASDTLTASRSSDYVFLDLAHDERGSTQPDTSWTCARCGGTMRSHDGKCTSCSLIA